MEEIKYPLNFDKCPVCGSERRVANEVMRGEKEKNKISPGAKAFLFNHKTVIADQRVVQLSVPAVLSFYDVCVDCGTLFCVHVDVKVAMPGPDQEPQRPPGGLFSPS